MRWLPICVGILAAVSQAQAARLVRERIEIRNFHKVERGFYRSGRPTEQGLRQLVRTRGLRTIVNLEDDGPAIAREAAWARSLGIDYISRPLHHRVMQHH